MSHHHFILQVQEQRRSEIIHEVKVHLFNTIKDVKRMLECIVNFPADRLRILLVSTMQVLQNTQVLSELSLPMNEPALLVSYGFGLSGGYKIEGAKGISTNDDTKDMLRQVQQGLNKNAPGKTGAMDCTGGVYFMKSITGAIVGVFKPQDEEQGMVNNPKGHKGNGTQGLRPHFQPGEGYLREYAAYLLDHENFCGVPTTTIASTEHPVFNYAHDSDKGTFPKVGSLQRYVRANDTFDDISLSMLSVFEVQKIALLDMRLLNCDRNGANILAVRKELPHPSERRSSRGESLSSVGELNDKELDVLDFIAGSSHFKESSRPADNYELIPIDHGYSLPTRVEIEDYDWVWFGSKQMHMPVDPRIKAYLKRLNFDDLIAKVTAEVALSEDTVFLLKTVHELIVQGVEEGLTLHDIASLICRVDGAGPSALEKLVARAEESAYSAIEVREGHRDKKVMAVSHNGSPVRRGKSPSTVLASTPPRAAELLKMKRVVKSSESLQDAYSDEGDARQSFSNSDDIFKRSVANAHDDDYFVKDLAGEQSPVPNTGRSSVLFSPTFAFQGAELKTMTTLDSSGLTLFFNSQKKKAAAAAAAGSSVETTGMSNENDSANKLAASSEPSPVGQSQHFGDYYEGLTTSEASSYESVGPSPRGFLDTSFVPTSRVPTFGSPFFQKSAAAHQTQEGKFPSMMVPIPAAEENFSGMERNYSFEACEVQTFQPLVFDKPSTTRGSSNNTAEDHTYDSSTDMDSMSSTPSEAMFEMLSLNNNSNNKKLLSSDKDQEVSPRSPRSNLRHGSNNGANKFTNVTTATHSTFSTDNLQSIPMARVSSFNALESPPLYVPDAGDKRPHHRLIRHLRREKRKHLGKSAEFPAFRHQFAHRYVKKLVASTLLSAGSGTA